MTAFLLLPLVLFATPDAGDQDESPVNCSEGNEPLALQYGDHTVGCEINPGNDIDTFTFQGAAGETVRFIVNGVFDNMDPRLQLFDPSFAMLFDRNCANVCTYTEELVLPLTGEYTLVMQDNGNSEVGDYSLQIEQLVPPGELPPLAYATSATIVIDHGTDHDFLEFEGFAGSTLLLAVDGTTDNMDPRMEVYDPTGAPPSLFDLNCSNVCTYNQMINVTQSGRYVLVFSDNGNSEAGTLSVSLNCLFGNCPTNATVTSRNGGGTNAECYSSDCFPVLGSVFESEVDTSAHSGATLTAILGYDLPSAGIVLPFGELLVLIDRLGGTQVFASTATIDGVTGASTHKNTIPNDPALAGLEVYSQAVIIGGGIELCNALDFRLGY